MAGLLRNAVLWGSLVVVPTASAAVPAAGASAFSAPPASGDAPGGGAGRAVREGIAVEFTAEAVEPARRGRPLREGDEAVLRFKLSDTATGLPLPGARPAGWADLRRPGEPAPDAEGCRARVKRYLEGSVFSAAELDLNAFYVLALNDDASLSVVDPLFEFGGSRLLALIDLPGVGEDWALTADEQRLFVSIPEKNQLSVVDTAAWKVLRNVAVDPRPLRLALQPDGEYLWIAHGASGRTDAGVTVVSAREPRVVARIPTGRGPHEVAFSADSRTAFVTNREEGTVSLVDVRTLKQVGRVAVGGHPASVAFSGLGQRAYVTNEDGSIALLEPGRSTIAGRLQADPGLGQIRFAPGDRLGFVVNPEWGKLYILDAAAQRIVQTADLDQGPDQLGFSAELAYVRQRGSESVLMVPLRSVGQPGTPVPLVDFPGGQAPFGKGARPSPASGFAQAPGENAMLVANPADQAIYYYKEGMAAPMGHFKNYGHEPRAVVVVDRSLRERAPGVYETSVRLRHAGVHDVAFFLDSPRAVHCFPVEVSPDPTKAARPATPARVVPLWEARPGHVGAPVRLRFKLLSPDGTPVRAGLGDVGALLVLAPGSWNDRRPARAEVDGSYSLEFTPSRRGVYYVYVESPTLGLSVNHPQYAAFEIEAAPAGGVR